MTKIKPIILKGTREYLPKEMAKRNLVMSKIRRIFERFGYDTIETPIINPTETILGKYGDEGDQLTYNFKDNGDRNIALPYDLTVPFARLVAANWQKLPIPFKRYQIQRVWRAEKPQKGRQREFYQCDIDIIGSKSLICEAEVAKIITTIFSELGFEKFIVKLNSRRLLNSILEKFEIEDTVSAIRIIDKLAKIGKRAATEMLLEAGVKRASELMKLLAPEKNNAETFEKLADCDSDALLIMAEPFGPTCHTGEISCFGGKFCLGDLFRLLCERKKKMPEDSYTTSLFQDGQEAILAKIEEESEEVVRAARSEGKQRLIEESCDLMYHLFVLLINQGIDFGDIEGELGNRNK